MTELAKKQEFQGHPLTRVMPVFMEIAKALERGAKKQHSEWKSERKIFKALDELYGPFDVDAAAASWNAQCPMYFTKKQNVLKHQLWGRVWANWPYNPAGELKKFMPYSRDQVLYNERVVLTCNYIPHYTAEGWWTKNVNRDDDLGKLLQVEFRHTKIGVEYARHYERMTIITGTIDGRRRFMSKAGQNDSARFSSAYVVFRKPTRA